MVSGIKWRLFMGFLIASCLTMDTTSGTQEIMRQLSVGFSKVLETCKNELKVGDHIIQDFYNFWKEDYQLVNKDFGCMVLCMASKHDLISEDMRIHHENAHAFAKTHGADEDTAKQLVTILHDCETQYLSIDDFCSRVVEVAKCFRTKIHDLKWAPNMEVILEEVMTSV